MERLGNAEGVKTDCVSYVLLNRRGEREWAIDPKLIDQLLVGYKKPEEIAGENGLLKQLTKAVIERALQAELTGHLDDEKHDPAGYKTGNSRNGKSREKLKGDFGEIELETPRDLQVGAFEPRDRGAASDAVDGI